MVEGESGIIACSPPWFKPSYEPSKRRLTWPNGARATIYAGVDPESLRGPQFDFAWCDELAKYRYAQDVYDMLMFGLRLGTHPRLIITTTPRPIPLLKNIITYPTARVTKGSTYDNLQNLSPNFREAITRKYEGTRLGRQELFAEILDDNPNALFSASDIEAGRMYKAPETLDRIVVAVDPPTTANPNSDECGIVAVGKADHHYYVLEDKSVQGKTPKKWAQRAINLYYKLNADAIVAEVNNGGDMVVEVFKNLDPDVKVIKVHATRGKAIRAEPVANLYEQHRVHHIGSIATLEDEMAQFDPELTNDQSWDRVDALVWAVTQLTAGRSSRPKVRQL